MFIRKININILASFLTLFSISLSGSAEARTLNSSIYFKGKYEMKTIYGTMNEWDGRVCTIINNKLTMGKIINSGEGLILNRKLTIVDTMLNNPVGRSEVPADWSNNPLFEKCIDETNYARCYVSRGTSYYSNTNESFRGTFDLRKQVFSIGQSTNDYSSRDKQVDAWAYFSFTPDESGFIVDYKKLECNPNLKN